MSINYQQGSDYDQMFQGLPKRHPLNKELSLSYDSVYKNAAVNVSKGPMICEYMDGLIETYKKQKSQYSKVYTVMVNLYFPPEWSESQRLQEEYFSSFMGSLKSQVEAHANRKRLEGDARTNQVRFCRVFEDGHSRGLHIHAVLFFNGHVFRTLGDFDSTRTNLYHRILMAWGSALGLYPCEISNNGLIDFSGKGYLIEPRQAETVKDMFYHYSYICKAYSKRFDLPVKAFSRSRG